MAKVLLVEDDNNLREIYEARLQAEGYEIVTANDGEQALVVAKNERPDLVISDVMMPKISGFEMLDILRNTDGLKEVKVIMLTALGQAEDKTRADQLGANRYLVKSQVTLEDIVRTAHQLLDDEPAESPIPATPVATNTAESTATTTQPVTAFPEPTVEPTAQAATPVDPAAAAAAASSAEPATVAQEAADMAAKIENFVKQPEPTPAPINEPAPTPAVAAPSETENDKTMNEAVDSLTTASEQKPSDVTAVEVPPEAPTPTATAPIAAPSTGVASSTPPEPVTAINNDSVTIAHKKIIQPISDVVNKPDLNALLAAEQAAQQADQPIAPPPVASTVAPQPGQVDPNSIAL